MVYIVYQRLSAKPWTVIEINSKTTQRGSFYKQESWKLANLRPSNMSARILQPLITRTTKQCMQCAVFVTKEEPRIETFSELVKLFPLLRQKKLNQTFNEAMSL